MQVFTKKLGRSFGEGGRAVVLFASEASGEKGGI